MRAVVNEKLKLKIPAFVSNRLQGAIGWIIPIAVLIAWQILGDLKLIKTLIFPTPLMIWESFIWLCQNGDLLDHINGTFFRTFVGFLIGGGLGLMIGLFVGLSKFCEILLNSTVQMIRMIPHISVTFLFVLWLGIGDASKIMLIAKGSFFPLYIFTFLGIRNVDNKLFEVTRILGYSKLKVITRLILPGIVPQLVLGIRQSLGIAWGSLVVAEMMGSSNGLGYLMMDARAMSDTATVFVGIILFTIFAKITDSIVLYFEKRILRWSEH